MDEYELRERREAAELALEGMTTASVNFDLIGQHRLSEQAANVAEEIAQELRDLQDGAA